MKILTETMLKQGKNAYVDAITGAEYMEKPEHMTHLKANILVPKSHPRIRFRGCLDTLQAEIVCLQAEAFEMGEGKLLSDLEDLMYNVHLIQYAEVKEEALEPVKILGMDEKELREKSHHVKKYWGIDHPVPNYSMGRMAASLNCLRTKIRETELMAACAFTSFDGVPERLDIIQHLNRMSSAVYIIFCRWLAGEYKEIL